MTIGGTNSKISGTGSVQCIEYRPEFLKRDSPVHDSHVMIRPRGYQAESAARRLIHHQHLYGSSITETAQYRFTSAAFMSKIRKLYRERVSQKRRCGRQRILSRNYLSLHVKFCELLVCDDM